MSEPRPTPAPLTHEDQIRMLEKTCRILADSRLSYQKRVAYAHHDLIAHLAALAPPPPAALHASAHAAQEWKDDTERCAVCGWPLDPKGDYCRRGNCSMRPLPERLYSPARAIREYANHAPKHWHQQVAAAPVAPARPPQK